MVRRRLAAALLIALLCLPVASLQAAGTSPAQEPRSAHREHSLWQQLLLPLLEALGIGMDPNGNGQSLSDSGLSMEPNGSTAPSSEVGGETSESGIIMDPNG